MKARVHLILLLFHHLNDTSRFKVHLPLKAPLLERREQMEGKKSTQVTTQWITALGKNKERERKGKKVEQINRQRDSYQRGYQIRIE